MFDLINKQVSYCSINCVKIKIKNICRLYKKKTRGHEHLPFLFFSSTMTLSWHHGEYRAFRRFAELQTDVLFTMMPTLEFGQPYYPERITRSFDEAYSTASTKSCLSHVRDWHRSLILTPPFAFIPKNSTFLLTHLIPAVTLDKSSTLS